MARPKRSTLGSWQPFTIEYVKTDNGLTEQDTVAYRSDGSHALIAALSSDSLPPMREFTDLNAGCFVVVDPVTKQYARVRVPREAARSRSRVLANCLEAYGNAPITFTCAPAGTAFGLSIFEARATTALPNSGTLERVITTSPAVNWAPISEKLVNASQVVSLPQAVALTLGDPDPALFSVPEGYQQATKMSDLLRSANAARGMPEPPDSYRIWERMDRGQTVNETGGVR